MFIWISSMIISSELKVIQHANAGYYFQQCYYIYNNTFLNVLPYRYMLVFLTHSSS